MYLSIWRAVSVTQCVQDEGYLSLYPLLYLRKQLPKM